MLAIKALVTVLGLLIAASMGLIVYGFYAGVADRQVDTEYQEPDRPGQLSGIVLPIGGGCRIVEAVMDGRRLLVRTGDEPVCQRIFVIDTKSNAIVTSVRPGP